MSRTVLITGCSAGGIGHALALSFHARGLRVFATARTLSSMEELSDKGIETLELDVSNSENIQNVKSVVSGLTGGSLDILVNNAGVYYQSAFTDLTMQRVREEMAVNFFAVVEMTHEFIPLLMKSSDARILLVGSASAVCPVPFFSIYNASKAAVSQFGHTLRVELAPFDIKVIQTYTGPVKSNILKPHTLPPNSLYTPIKEQYENANRDVFGKAAIPMDGFVKQLATEVLKKNPKAVLWGGANATMTRLVNTVAHSTGWDWLVSNMMGVDKMPRRQNRSKSD